MTVSPGSEPELPGSQSLEFGSSPADLDGETPLLGIDDVQRQLRRSRASVYRYANTSPDILNPPFDPQCLNAEVRADKDAPLKFHPNEVRRFARDVLGLNPTIEVQPSAETTTNELLRQILSEMQQIRTILEGKSSHSA